MRKPILFLSLVLLLFPLHSVHSQVRLTLLTPAGKDAYQSLLTAPRFEDDAIGFAAVPSKLVGALNVLLQEPNGDAAFKSLLLKAKPAGQLYALCGLYFTDYDAFKAGVEDRKFRLDFVVTQFGCIGSRRKASDIIALNDPKVVRLSSNKQSLDEWQKQHPEVKDGYYLDISGGGYPRKFLRAKSDGDSMWMKMR